MSEVSKDFPIHFRKTTIDDPTLAKGQTRLQTAGVDGVLTRTYRVTTTDGVETDRVQVSRTVSTAPVPEVTAVGSYVEPAPAPAAPAPAPAAPAPRARRAGARAVAGLHHARGVLRRCAGRCRRAGGERHLVHLRRQGS
ncbi:G5 domain-containing protein [Curtobacterium flaccumfaciens]|nr:G5 domain-containing protein [Curtobacterium flaccumfaciens]